MSLDAMVWALKRAPVDDPIAHLVLIGLADHADPDGREARPSQRRLAEYVNVTDRTVRTKLRLLEEQGLIRPGDEQLVAHLPPGRRPLVWDLCMGMTRESPRAETASGRNAGSGVGGSGVPVTAEAEFQSRRNTASDRTVHEPSSEPSENRVGDADATSVREDVSEVCRIVSEHVQLVTGKRPTVGARWQAQARLMLDADGHSVDDVRAVMAWVTASSFWSPNILSVPKLREKWPTLVGQARRDLAPGGGWVAREMQRAATFAGGGAQ